MGGSLQRAWEIVRILDDVDSDGHWDEEVARAMFLTAPENQQQIAPPPLPVSPARVAHLRQLRAR